MNDSMIILHKKSRAHMKNVKIKKINKLISSQLDLFY